MNLLFFNNSTKITEYTYQGKTYKVPKFYYVYETENGLRIVRRPLKEEDDMSNDSNNFRMNTSNDVNISSNLVDNKEEEEEDIWSSVEKEIKDEEKEDSNSEKSNVWKEIKDELGEEDKEIENSVNEKEKDNKKVYKYSHLQPKKKDEIKDILKDENIDFTDNEKKDELINKYLENMNKK